MNSQERRRLIEDRKRAKGEKFKLWCRGEWRQFDVWEVPVESLLLNVDNRRFTAEKKLMEERLRHPLDPENSPDDELSVVSILLDSGIDVDGDRIVGKPSKDYEALREDWLRRKQETPFWIRPDGAVRNGNRRLATIKRLQNELGDFAWVDAIVLDPVEVDEQELFEMEQREQLTENLKVRYTDINLLLALRDAAIARNIDWADSESIDRVAGALQNVAGGDKAYAAIQLQAVRYMDGYLDDTNAQGEYQNLIRQVERFRDVGKIMARMEVDYPDEAPDMLRLAFAAITAGNPHGDIRLLWKMFVEDRPRYELLVSQVRAEERDWQEAAETKLGSPDLSAPEGEGQGDGSSTDEDTPGPVVANYPGKIIKTKIKNAIDGFSASKLEVASTLEQVLNRLHSLVDDRNRLEVTLQAGSAEVRAALLKIVEWADSVRSLLTED